MCDNLAAQAGLLPLLHQLETCSSTAVSVGDGRDATREHKWDVAVRSRQVCCGAATSGVGGSPQRACWPDASEWPDTGGQASQLSADPVACLGCLLVRSQVCNQSRWHQQALQLVRRAGLRSAVLALACLPARHRAGSFKGAPRRGCCSTMLHRQQSLAALSFKATSATSLRRTEWVVLLLWQLAVCQLVHTALHLTAPFPFVPC